MVKTITDISAHDSFSNENPFYRKVTKEESKWVKSRINHGLEMTRINPETNYVEARPLTAWEDIKDFFGLLKYK